jgi:hypothetical protein
LSFVIGPLAYLRRSGSSVSIISHFSIIHKELDPTHHTNTDTVNVTLVSTCTTTRIPLEDRESAKREKGRPDTSTRYHSGRRVYNMTVRWMRTSSLENLYPDESDETQMKS